MEVKRKVLRKTCVQQRLQRGVGVIGWCYDEGLAAEMKQLPAKM
jgi:hypothetical protein